MSFSVQQIASLLGCPDSVTAPHTPVNTLLIDSRSLLDPEGSLFFALRTGSGDGHAYIAELYGKGVRNFVVETLPADPSSMPGACFLTVPSTLDALQRVGAAWRDLTDPEVLAITGSRGKTTVKEWICTMLADRLPVSRSPRSYNSRIGVPLSLYAIDPASQVAVIEAGVSRKGEMARLEALIKPDIVLITNIGAPHSEGFDSITAKAAEKASLACGASRVIYCADDALVAASLPEGPVRYGWTMADAPDAALKLKVTPQPSSRSSLIRYTLRSGELSGSFTVPFTATRDLENLGHSLAAVLLLLPSLSAEEVSEMVARLRPVHTRLEVVEGICDSLLIHDRFTGDISSLIPALDFMSRRAVPTHGLTLVLGDLHCDGHTPSETYRKALSIARARGVGRVVIISKAIMSLSGDDEEETTIYPTVKAFLAAETPERFRSQLVLVKGAPEEPLSEVCRMLERRRNETVLEINLDAVVDNFNFFRSLVRPTTGIVCMIKASGYGAGSHELARTLQSQGASYLAVAVHDEGADLRQAGITMPVIVLNPAVDDLSAIFDNRLEPEIYSIEFLRSLIAEAQRRSLRDYPVHIKIDSGMHRLGFTLETLPEVIELLRSQHSVAPASIFSHLCAADDPADDDYTRSQFSYFDSCCEMLLGAFPERRILRHILNSTGIVRFPERQYDMVRLGIGLYGVRTMHDGSMDALRPVSALYTSIISLKHWPEGTTIGYNRRGRLTRPSVIATVPIGYADGLNRHLGYGNARFNVGGVMCPTVGSICMDACMIDVTDVPDVHTGQRVEVFGDTIPVETLSDTLETIPYEILTSISQRVKRVYYRE